MKISRLKFLFCVQLLAVLCFSCFDRQASKNTADPDAAKNNNLADVSVNVPTPSPTPPAGFPDFRNFKYPGYCFDGHGESFTLTDGEFKKNKKGGMWMRFNHSYFADVTGDGDPEAMVVLSIITGGSSTPDCVYIFSRSKGEHRKLIERWAFETGDRADSGLRRIYDENGNLVIERYLYEGNLGDCCPQYYLKETYRWSHNKFNKVNEKKVSNPVRAAEQITSEKDAPQN